MSFARVGGPPTDLRHVGTTDDISGFFMGTIKLRRTSEFCEVRAEKCIVSTREPFSERHIAENIEAV